ncbi:MAG: orotate phosphoribosyltransferase, partial [Acidobacteriales bacterium]|nr:orotate phosphoribosyltransferase [Terriglobales bacterium]
LVTQSYKEGQFTLASGATSDYYIDCRATTLHARGAWLTGRVVLDTIRQLGWEPDAVGGLTLGADPIVVATSLLSAQDHAVVGSSAGKPISGFLVRKAEKQHGMQRRLEGFLKPGASVVVVDDVCTTGGSTIQAIEAVADAEMKVLGVICLVERQAEGIRNIEERVRPAPVLSIFTVDDLRRRYALR